MLSPLQALAGVGFALITSFGLYYFGLLNASTYFFTPILLLILFHTVIMQLSSSQKNSKIELRKVIPKSIGKYLFWALVIGAAYSIYTHHPFYIRFAPNTAQMLSEYLKAYVVLGLLYFAYVERYKTGRFEWLHDTYIKFLSLVRVVYRRQWGRLRYRVVRRGYKSWLLSWLLRLHFLPVMVEQVYWGTGQTVNGFNDPAQALTNVMFLVGLLFLIDSVNASIGYFWESSVTRTRFRAMDPNAFHWFAVLICYMPFIAYASNFVPFPQGDGALLIDSAAFAMVFNAITILSLLGIVLTTSCLGFSYSNLCYKKIQTRGPYALVRHPGTVFKIVFFFGSIFRYESSYTLPLIAAFIFWMGVYIVRILCEERFLRDFQEYRDYMQKTRYRLIPGVW